ncbi:serine/arginine-rich splicing factor 1-like [Watersipora subatra]|uniref:serine/arginine-rich splicing factor 1-like n=1 Tax=Watersipora subatra TaxID=2589382 RepID=UPI00355C948F
MSREKLVRIYVGNLPPDIRSNEVEQLFEKYGKIVKVELKNGAGRGPPFAFIEFEDYRDAEDAVRTQNGANYDGYALRVEVPHGARDGGRGPRGPPRYDDRRDYYSSGGRGGYDRGYDRGYNQGYGRDRGGGHRDNGYASRDRQRAPPVRRKYKVVVTGIPKSATVGDLKKHMKDAGDVISVKIRDEKGYIEYDNNEDMRYALKKIDDTELETEDGDKRRITVRECRESSRSRTRSTSPARRKTSPSYSPKRSRSRSP